MQILAVDVRPVPEQIAESGSRHPQSIALSHGERQLTFQELDRRADQFAGYLAQAGVKPGDTIAICMDRSIDWIVSALGIMRAGAAYVPLDAAWPDTRLRFAIQDSAAVAFVAPADLIGRLQVKARGIDLSRDRSLISANRGKLRVTIQPESLAYLIYTSGSSGTPKGVEITHANLAHLVRWHQSAFDVTRNDRASHLAGLGFDAAVWELWPNLSVGASVCLADDAIRSSPELMQQWMVRERVTIAFAPTVHAGPMLAMEWPLDTALRFLLTGGDALRQGPERPLPFQVVNNYGPSECTVVATSGVLEPGASGPPSIGSAIAGTTVYLLDELGEPVADGATGEIYIGGTGVGRGYRNLPEATALSFLPDPFAGFAGARMYRTGDRGTFRRTGEIEFRGRLDRQTKIRGQRIELDEIASILTHHAHIEFATAITNQNAAGENQLVAYVVPKPNVVVPTLQELQKHLLRSLPEYMVPAIFVRLQSIPVSANGKLDLTHLPAPSDKNLLERTTARAPSTATEQQVLHLVRELLEKKDIAADDNFFLAGGHSLLGMQLVMRLGATFEVDLSLRQLFEAPTSERLATVVETILEEKRLAVIWEDLLGRKGIGPNENFFELGGNTALIETLQHRIAEEFGQHIPADKLVENSTIRKQSLLAIGMVKAKPVVPPGVVVLQPHGNRNSIFWVHYLSVSLAKVVGDDQPFLSVMLTADDLQSLGASPTLQSIAACLVKKILVTQPVGPYTLGGFCLGGILAYEIACQVKAAGLDVALLVLLDTPNPSFLDTRYPLAPRLSDPAYLLKRLRHLGVQKSFDKIRERVRGGLAISDEPATAKSEMSHAQKMIERAAAVYRPQLYDGKVLLLLATDRPAHVDFLPGWQAVVPNHLHTHYLDGHHDDLIKALNVRSVADAIVSFLKSSTARLSSLAPGSR